MSFLVSFLCVQCCLQRVLLKIIPNLLMVPSNEMFFSYFHNTVKFTYSILFLRIILNLFNILFRAKSSNVTAWTPFWARSEITKVRRHPRVAFFDGVPRSTSAYSSAGFSNCRSVVQRQRVCPLPYTGMEWSWTLQVVV